MTIPSTARKAGPLLGTGAQTTWPFTFKVFAATDIAVTIANSLGVETALVYGVDYSVSLNANQETSPGGTVTYPISGSALPVGSQLVIVGNLPYDQPLDLPAGGNFSPLAIENELDRLTMQVQQLRERVGRAVQVRVTADADVTLPPPEANELIGWDSTGQNLQNFALSELATAVAYTTMRYDTFTGDGVETQFTLTADPVTLANLDVAISGVTQVPGTDYSLVSGVLVFASAPANGTQILARYGEGLVNVGGDSSDIRFLQAGTGAVDRTVESKLRGVVNVKDFGAVGNGTADDTVAIQNAMTAAAAENLPLEFAGGTFAVSSTGTFALTAPATLTMLGVPGATIIKLISTTGDTHIIGRSSASTYFRMEGITLDGNKSVISTRNVGGLYFGNAQVVISRRNTFKDMNDLGAYASKCVYVEASALGEYAESTGDQYLNCEGYPFQTYRIARNIVEDAYCTGALTSFTDINGQTIPSTIYAKTQINNNVVICDAAFPISYSVLSLMGNDIECVGNKITGGGTQIVCHDGTTDTLYNYLVSGNYLWQSKGTGIVVNQSSGASANNRNVVVSNNMIYQPTADGIVVVGTYAGGATTPQASITISGNVVYDYLTNNPDPGSTISAIRLLSTVNCTVSGNSIIGPRWAGITCHYDGRNIDIIGNVISDHQGRTDTTPQHGAPIFIAAGSATAYLGNINVSGNTIRNYCSTVSPASTSIRTGGIVINEANAQDITVRGNRIMDGNACGITLYNCVRVTAMDNEVRGVGGSATALNTSSGVGAGCQLAYAISGPTYDTTANRPTLQSTQAGYSMWDSTLNKPIWWNGSVWKDASNATV